MDRLFDSLQYYCEAHTSDPGELLQRLERETHLKTLAPQMLSGKLQGQFLKLISMLVRPVQALEVGTFTGYAALCMAYGLPEHGVLHTIEANPELEHIIRSFLAESPVGERVQLHLGDAREVIPNLEGPFQLVFLDAGKLDYLDYYEMIIPKMSSGGLLLADNVLWSGKVLEQAEDDDTRVLQAFNERVQQDHRVENIMLPLRDGLTIARVR